MLPPDTGKPVIASGGHLRAGSFDLMHLNSNII